MSIDSFKMFNIWALRWNTLSAEGENLCVMAARAQFVTIALISEPTVTLQLLCGRCARCWTQPPSAASPPRWKPSRRPTRRRSNTWTSSASSSTTSRLCSPTTTPALSTTPTRTWNPLAWRACWSRSLELPSYSKYVAGRPHWLLLIIAERLIYGFG